MIKKVLFVGADPSRFEVHAGGQLTAALGILEFAKKNNIDIKIVDSAQSSFPVPNIFMRLASAGGRFFSVLSILLSSRICGAIIFCSGVGSFYEKTILALLCKVFNVKVLLFPRSGHFMESVNTNPHVRFWVKKVLSVPDFIGAQGRPWVEFYEGIGVPKSNIVKINNWVPSDLEMYNEDKSYVFDPASNLTFVYIGWLVKKKGVLELLEAIKSSDILRNCSVLLAGGGDLETYVKAQVMENNLTNVKVLGWVEKQDVYNLLKKSNVFVLPSYAEGFSNALLEALCFGLAIITTAVGGNTESAIQSVNAELIDVGSSESLRAAMEKFYFHPELVERYSRNSRKLALENHSREETCKKLFSLFEL